MSTNLPLPVNGLPQIGPINLGDKTALEKTSTDALELANTMVIDSLEMAELMQSECAVWGRHGDDTEACRIRYTKPFQEATKTIMDWFRPVRDNFITAREIGKRKVAEWQTAERARVEREEAVRREEARKERERLEAESREAARLAQEKEREAKLALEAAARAEGEEKKKLEEEAAAASHAAEAQRETAATSMAISQVITPAPVVPAAKVTGMRFGTRVEFEVVNKAAALAWFAANPIFADVVEFPEAKLRAMEKSLGDQFQVPGIKVTRPLAASSNKAA